jgi:predicted lipid carrier protein YhbT
MSPKKGKARSKEASTGENIASLVTKTLGNVTHQLVAQSGIFVEVTDAGGQGFHVSSGGGGVQVRAGAPTSAVGVRIRGSAARLRALLDGKKHPSAVFVEGGIEVTGDARQILALSEELPVVTGAPKLTRRS